MDINEHIARNELMAKYMMENSHIGDMIKDYNVGINFITENLQRGTQEDKNTSTVVLSDFQVLEFDHILDKDGQSDDDGLSDLTELKTNTKWVNIAGPMKKYYDEMVSNGKTSKSYVDVLEDLAKKQGKYIDFNGNVVWGHLKYEVDSNLYTYPLYGGYKVYYRTRDYNSNPMLNDTDFDGLQDNIDSNKINGTFKGSANNIGQVEYTSDFRYFFVDNNKYNDELSTMSLMMCNLADGEHISTNQVNGDIRSYMRDLGFAIISEKSQFKVADGGGNIVGKMYLGKKTIQIGANRKDNKKYKDVYGIFLGSFDTVDNYKFLITESNADKIKSYYQHIIDDIVNYIRNNIQITNDDYCFWITGYGISGGVASEVASKLKENGEIYCYTFGGTNAGSSTDANSEIKNIINEDDLIPKIYNHIDGFAKSGILYNNSIYDNLKTEYRKLVGSVKEYKANYKRANTLKELISRARKYDGLQYRNEIEQAEAKILCKYQYINEDFILSYDRELLSSLNASVTKIKQGHEKKSYYVLSKTLNGFDRENEESGWNDIDDKVDSEIILPDDKYDHIYIEIDWQEGYAPNIDQLQIVVDMFKKHNIILHIDAGEYSINYDGDSESNIILNMPNRSLRSEDENFIEKIVEDNFSKRKNFRYCLYIKQYEGANGITDNIPGRFCLFSKKSISEYPYSNKEAATFMHELGHSLGLKHGGDEHTLYKPNYVSIMNYLNSYEGLLANDDVNYSEYEFPQIKDFNHIDESVGIDPSNIGKEILGIRWRLRKNKNSFSEHYQYYTDGKHIDFNLNDIVENNVKIDFYIGYADLWSMIVSTFYKNCKQSINDWIVVKKNIIPCEMIEYSTFKEKFEGEVE